MTNHEVYVFLGKVFNHIVKISLSVIEDKKKFKISDNYILESVRELGFNTLNRIKKSGEEIAFLDREKNCMLIFKFVEEFLVLDLICSLEYANIDFNKKNLNKE